MSFSNVVRTVHRWTSIAFTLGVIANFVAMGVKPGEMPPPYITYSPLPPLFLLLFTGWFLFALPYVRKSG